jgi:ribonuclease G
MPRNTLVINCDIRETRVALIEEGVIAELQIERATARGTVGHIVLGRVTRVLPGMQAAFIDVGMDRAAFLHVEDLIRPDDFESYLAGARRHQEEEGFQKGDGGRRHGGAAASGEGPAAVDEDDEDDDDDDDDEAEEPVQAVSSPIAVVDPELEEDEEEEEEDGDEDDASDPLAADDEEEEEEEEVEENEVDEDEEDVTQVAEELPDGPAVDPELETEHDDLDDDLDDDDSAEPAAVTGAEVGDLASTAGAPAEAEPGSLRKRRRRRRRRGRDPEASASSPQAAAEPPLKMLVSPREPRREARPEPRKEPARDARGGARQGRSNRDARVAQRPTGATGNGNGRDRGGSREARNGNAGELKSSSSSSSSSSSKDGKRLKGIPRVSRSVPITEVVKEGDEVIVQISKEPIGTKGARVTSHVSLPGRYVVYLPTVDHVGVSKRIGSARERARLREVVELMKPPTGGIIVRTVAEGLTKKNLKGDIGYLVRLWEDVLKKRAGAKAPSVLYTELDLVLKTARDLFTDEIESIVIDDKAEYARLVRFVEMFMPTRVKDIHYYSGDEPIFDAYGIEDEISRALSRKVPLPSGGYLIIDQAEALTAIDVNTGRFVGKGSKDLEETALKTNLEAVEEIAYQLRFRNIGGLVILDLIDMDGSSNREKVWRALEQRLAKDKAKTTINRISELGLIEMTRKRTRESLTRTMHETCFYCDGTGQIQSRTTIAYEILRQIRRERHNLTGYSVLVNAHPAVVDLMTGEEREAVTEAERRYMRRIEFNPRREYHIEQFDLQGK